MTATVTTRRVSFPHGDHDLVGTLFLPADFDDTARYPAVVTTHPFGGVKEQTAGLYSQHLAEHGIVAVAYDASHYGESGGEPRLYEVPGDRVEDIRCAVDFLSNHPNVDPDRIGALGICAGGGYTVNAAQTEYRIQAVATVSAFDVGSARREGVPRGLITPEQRIQRLHDVGAQRTREARGEPLQMISFVPASAEEITDDTPELYREGYDYYCTPRAQHPNAPGKYVFTSLGLQMAFYPFQAVETISPRPLLMIIGSHADTAYFSEEAIAKANEPKELFVVPGATHIDRYDRDAYIPLVVSKLVDFFNKHLSTEPAGSTR
jgi:fermentation-respiration switch protein FrsA (DUF1100 family)